MILSTKSTFDFGVQWSNWWTLYAVQCIGKSYWDNRIWKHGDTKGRVFVLYSPPYLLNLICLLPTCHNLQLITYIINKMALNSNLALLLYYITILLCCIQTNNYYYLLFRSVLDGNSAYTIKLNSTGSKIFTIYFEYRTYFIMLSNRAVRPGFQRGGYGREILASCNHYVSNNNISPFAKTLHVTNLVISRGKKVNINH